MTNCRRFYRLEKPLPRAFEGCLCGKDPLVHTSSQRWFQQAKAIHIDYGQSSGNTVPEKMYMMLTAMGSIGISAQGGPQR
eukprot:5495129-Amphidinium_carterae.1